MAETTNNNKEKLVTIDEKVIQQLMKDNKDLKKAMADINSGKPPVLRKVKEKVCKMRMYSVDGKQEEKFVLGWTDRKTFTVYDKQREEGKRDRLHIELILWEKDKPVEVDYLDFLNGSRKVEVKIADIKKREVIKEDGYLKRKIWDGKYGMKETDVLVPIEVTSIVRDYILELPLPGEAGENGKFEKVKVNEEFINI